MEQLEQLRGYFSFVEGWMIHAFIVVFIFAVASFVQKRVLRKLHERASRTANTWDDALFEALRKPLSILLWVIGVTLAADIIHRKADAPIFEYAGEVREIGVVVCLIWFAIRLAVNIENNYIQRRGVSNSTDLTSIQAIGKVVRLALIVTGGLIVLQTLGISVSGVLAFGGIGGLAIGFAARDMLANFFGALSIFWDRPFEVGNWVRSPDREIEGVVEDIGWRLTRIRTFDKRPLYVPNAIFTTIVLENPSRMSHRRIYETIGVRYNDVSRLPEIIRRVREMLDNHEALDQNQTIIVNFNAFGASSLDFFVYCFTHTTAWGEYHQVKQDVLLQISRSIEEHDAEVAFPTRTLHMPEEVLVAMENRRAES
jgi:MscS family membrane protein